MENVTEFCQSQWLLYRGHLEQHPNNAMGLQVTQQIWGAMVYMIYISL